VLGDLIAGKEDSVEMVDESDEEFEIDPKTLKVSGTMWGNVYVKCNRYSGAARRGYSYFGPRGEISDDQDDGLVAFFENAEGIRRFYYMNGKDFDGKIIPIKELDAKLRQANFPQTATIEGQK